MGAISLIRRELRSEERRVGSDWSSDRVLFRSLAVNMKRRLTFLHFPLAVHAFHEGLLNHGRDFAHKKRACMVANPITPNKPGRGAGHRSEAGWTPIRAATVRERLISACGCRIRSLTVAALIGVLLR